MTLDEMPKAVVAKRRHVSWNRGKGKGWTDRRGYRWIRVNCKSIREHRYIMQQHLGRPLNEGEVVHHINGNIIDNRIENLSLMRAGDHTREHHNGSMRHDLVKRRLATTRRYRRAIKDAAARIAALETECAALRKQLVTLMCPCCGEEGAIARYFEDGQETTCGCGGIVFADGECAYISVDECLSQECAAPTEGSGT